MTRDHTRPCVRSLTGIGLFLFKQNTVTIPVHATNLPVINNLTPKPCLLASRICKACWLFCAYRV